MSIFKCKMCGGTIEFEQGDTVGTCEYCGTKQTLPKTNDDVTANLFNRANNLRLKCEFDKAEQIYEKIVQQDDSEAEAHWGIVLCKYGIEYVEDPKTMERIPTCHRTLFDAVTADPDYLAAVDYSDASQQVLYEAEARKIDRIQKDILEIVKNEKPFDVFLCYKESDDNGKRTVDSAIANDIYYQLTQEGFKVFYAAITLEDKLGTEYEPYIFAALNSAKVMLVIGTKPEYFNAVWVKNEWSRYLKLMKTDRSRLLIPCYRDMDAYDLPEEFAHLQAQDMSKIGFINDITRGIKKVLGGTVQKAEVKPVQSEAGSSTAPLLKRAFMALEDGEWEKADNFCEQVLNQDPENANAYLGKLMAELHVKKQDDLRDCAEPFDSSSNYQKAVRFGDAALAQNLKDCIKNINERNENAKCERIYQSVLKDITISNTEEAYRASAKRLNEIANYKDSEALAKQYLEKAEKLKSERLAKEEAARLEAERKAEERRIAAEKAAKKIKKTLAIVIPIVIVAIAAVVLTAKVFIPNSKYNAAVELMNVGKYEEAIAAFEALNGYKDSENQIENCYIGKYGEDKWNRIKNIKVGDTYTFGTYEQDNNASNGKENIEWLVLDKQDDKILVISKYALDCQQYNTSYTDVTWETCALRKWMNGTFLNNAFSVAEQAQIQNTATVNATTDKAFLLSIAEVEKCFSSDSARQCKPTKYAVDNGAYVNSDNGNCWWWLRSPGSSHGYAARVYAGGSVDYKGDFVHYDGDAVRPAMWINIGELQ